MDRPPRGLRAGTAVSFPLDASLRVRATANGCRGRFALGRRCNLSSPRRTRRANPARGRLLARPCAGRSRRRRFRGLAQDEVGDIPDTDGDRAHQVLYDSERSVAQPTGGFDRGDCRRLCDIGGLPADLAGSLDHAIDRAARYGGDVGTHAPRGLDRRADHSAGCSGGVAADIGNTENNTLGGSARGDQQTTDLLSSPQCLRRGRAGNADRVGRDAPGGAQRVANLCPHQLGDLGLGSTQALELGRDHLGQVALRSLSRCLILGRVCLGRIGHSLPPTRSVRRCVGIDCCSHAESQARPYWAAAEEVSLRTRQD